MSTPEIKGCLYSQIFQIVPLFRPHISNIKRNCFPTLEGGGGVPTDEWKFSHLFFFIDPFPKQDVEAKGGKGRQSMYQAGKKKVGGYNIQIQYEIRLLYVRIGNIHIGMTNIIRAKPRGCDNWQL